MPGPTARGYFAWLAQPVSDGDYADAYARVRRFQTDVVYREGWTWSSR